MTFEISGIFFLVVISYSYQDFPFSLCCATEKPNMHSSSHVDLGALCTTLLLTSTLKAEAEFMRILTRKGIPKITSWIFFLDANLFEFIWFLVEAAYSSFDDNTVGLRLDDFNFGLFILSKLELSSLEYLRWRCLKVMLSLSVVHLLSFLKLTIGLLVSTILMFSRHLVSIEHMFWDQE